LKFVKTVGHVIRLSFRYLPLRRRVLFYTVRADGRLLDNAESVYNALDEKKLIFAQRLPHTEAKKLWQYYLLLTSKVIVTDDYIRYLRSVRLRPRQKLIQIWHAGGYMKKFGLDAPSRLTPEEEKATHSQYDAVIVSSEGSRACFSSAMGVDVGRFLPLGLPRTDALLSAEKKNDARVDFLKRFPELSGKRLYVYCPTFREKDGKKVEFDPLLDWDALDNALNDNEMLVVHRHPVMKNPFFEGSYRHIVDLSAESMNALLCAADVLITDYSSVVLDALLLDIPPVFYCPDMNTYERDFYFSFPQDLPGDTVTQGEMLVDAARRALLAPQTEKMKKFRRDHMGACDGKSTERVVSLIKDYLNGR